MKHIGNITFFVVTVYVGLNSELIQTSKIEIFAKVVKGLKASTICARTPS